MPETPDAYKILQVDREADPEVIQAAYRRLAQKYHPDVAGDPNSEAGREAMARMVAINAAWAVLRDLTQRAGYDRELAARTNVALGASPPAGGGWDRRDQAAPHSVNQPPGAPVGSSSSPARAAGGATESTWSARVSDAGNTTGGANRVRGPDPALSTRTDSGAQAAASPPGRPSGSVLNFGRYRGWSLGQIGHVDPQYLEWLVRAPIGRAYTVELDVLLRKLGRMERPEVAQKNDRGLFRRR